MSTLRDHLFAIRDANKGRLTPDLVVDAARPKSSPLHHRFEWNDKAAGEAYRRVQAEQLIREVRVKYTDPKGKQQSTRAFVASRFDDYPDDSNYRPIEEVVADPFAYQVLLQECRREWKSFEAKYRHLEEFASIVNGEAEAA